MPKLSILGHMLLHKSYINVTIANILLCSLSLYDLPGPKCKNWSRRVTLKKGVAQNAWIQSSTKMEPRLNVFYIIQWGNNRWEIALKSRRPSCFKIPKIAKKCLPQWPKKGFLAITPKLSILGHMLLHKSYINVAIANILLCSLSLYDLPGPKCKNWSRRVTLKKGVAQNAWFQSSTKMEPRLNVFYIIQRGNNRWEIAFNTKS